MRNIQILATEMVQKYYLMTMKSYKIWILLKLNLKIGNQKIVCVGYVRFTLIEYVFFKKVKKPELVLQNRSFCTVF